MCRPIPFMTRGVCIDCGAQHDRDYSAWRCWDCTNALEAVRNSAMRAVVAAIKAGDLPPVRDQVCVDCEQPAVHYDHRDYSQPLKVAPRCRSCNYQRGPGLWQRPQYAA